MDNTNCHFGEAGDHQLAGAMWRNGKAFTLSARRTWLTAIKRSHITYSSNAFLPMQSYTNTILVKLFSIAYVQYFFAHPPTSSSPLVAELRPVYTTPD